MPRSTTPAEVRRLPNLVIVGVSRGGTTSLFHYLGEHPDVGTADVKEVRYFTALRHGEPLAPIESYAEHFTHCSERYALEATPGYFAGGGLVARAMRETCPGVRAVVSLRAPADRCWSWFQFVKSRDRIPQDMGFDAYLDRCLELHAAGSDGTVESQPYFGLGGGCYDRWLDDWIDEFGDDFRVLFFEDVVADPRRTVAEVCRWLDLDPGLVADSAYDVNNKSEQYRHRRLQRMALAVNRRGERFFHQHRTTKRLLRRAYYSVNRGAPDDTMSASARQQLAQFYAPHNARLAKQLADVGIAVPSSWSEVSP